MKFVASLTTSLNALSVVAMHGKHHHHPNSQQSRSKSWNPSSYPTHRHHDRTWSGSSPTSYPSGPAHHWHHHNVNDEKLPNLDRRDTSDYDPGAGWTKLWGQGWGNSTYPPGFYSGGAYSNVGTCAQACTADAKCVQYVIWGSGSPCGRQGCLLYDKITQNTGEGLTGMNADCGNLFTYSYGFAKDVAASPASSTGSSIGKPTSATSSSMSTTSASAGSCKVASPYYKGWCGTAFEKNFTSTLSSTKVTSSVVIPAYDLGDDITWLTTILSTYASVNFVVIVSPNNGPDTIANLKSNNVEFLNNLIAIRKYKNAKIIGYIDTDYASRTQAAVTADINAYIKWTGQKWTSTTAASGSVSVSLDGVYLDNLPDGKIDANYSKYKAWTTTLRGGKWQTTTSLIGTGMGTPPGDNRFFALLDFILVYMEQASAFESNMFNNFLGDFVSITAAQRTQVGVILMGIADKPSQTNAKNAVLNLKKAFGTKWFVASKDGADGLDFWSATDGDAVKAVIQGING